MGGKVKNRHDRAALHGAGKVRWELVATRRSHMSQNNGRCAHKVSHLGDVARKQLIVSEGVWKVTRDAWSHRVGQGG